MEECSSKPNEETEAASKEKVNQNNKIEEDVLNELKEATNGVNTDRLELDIPALLKKVAKARLNCIDN